MNKTSSSSRPQPMTDPKDNTNSSGGKIQTSVNYGMGNILSMITYMYMYMYVIIHVS